MFTVRLATKILEIDEEVIISTNTIWMCAVCSPLMIYLHQLSENLDVSVKVAPALYACSAQSATGNPMARVQTSVHRLIPLKVTDCQPLAGSTLIKSELGLLPVLALPP